VRTLDDLLKVRALGVTRVGATATEAILTEALKRNFPAPIPAGLELREPVISTVAPSGY